MKKHLFLRFVLISLGLVPLLFIAIAFIPSVQKYLIENQLTPWVSMASVDSIHITPFSIQIKNLRLKYEAIDLQINRLDSEFSLLNLFDKRIKIDKFVLDHIQIEDASIATASKDDSRFIYYGLFPYLDTGFIYDIGLLDVNIQYNSSTTGPVEASLNAQNINENTNNPIALKVTARNLPDIPDLQGVLLDSKIRLNQSLTQPVNAHQSQFDLTLYDSNSIEQYISIQLDMKQLAKPDKWAAFPFDKYQTHYLQELLHPESINLKITHTNSDAKVLSEIQFKGQYDGNEGIISGAAKLITDKTITRQIKSLALPEIESKLTATFTYNLRRLEGNINLIDEFIVEDYIQLYSMHEDKNLQQNNNSQPGNNLQLDKTHQNEKSVVARRSSFPEQFKISNHLIASISDNQLLINNFLLKFLSNNHEYINIFTHKPLSLNLEHLSDFFEQQNGKLLRINISQLPLNWLNDLTPDYHIKNGFLDTDINLEIENKTLKLTSNHPVSLKNISIIDTTNNAAHPESSKQLQETIHPPNDQPLLLNQNLEADFLISINKTKLEANIKQLKLYQGHKEKNKIIQQANASLYLDIESPIKYFEQEKKLLPPVLSIDTKGKFDLHALTKIPYISRLIEPKDEFQIKSKSVPTLLQSFPETLSLNYQFKINNTLNLQSVTWNVDQSTIKLFTGKNDKKKSPVFSLKKAQTIQIEQNKDQFKLLSEGPLVSAKINQFNISWLSSMMNQYVPDYNVSGKLSQMDLLVSAKKQTSEKTEKNEAIHFLLDINPFILSKLEVQENKNLLFDNININTKIHADYSPDQLILSYPLLTIKKSNKLIIDNNGSLLIRHPGDKKNQSIVIKGNLKGFVHNIMSLKLVKQYAQTRKNLNQKSLLNAKYHLKITDKNLNIKNSQLKILHPKSNGQLIITTQKPISLSLKNKKYNFSKNGHLSFKLINFDSSPYESILSEIPITFDHANAHFDLVQMKKKQKIIMKEPFVVHNIHFKEKEKSLLNPFDLTLDFSASQHKNITKGKIKQLSIDFLATDSSQAKTINAFKLKTDFVLDLDNEIILSELDGDLDLLITQWLNQPAAIPKNTLAQGTLSTKFSIDNSRRISHKWLINNLVDNNNKQLVESISIDGTGQLHGLSNFALELPIIMKSISGESNLLLKTQTHLQKTKKKLSMSIEGKEIFLNDLLKLLAAINPHSEISKLEKTDKKDESEIDKQQPEKQPKPLNKTPASEPFWKSGLDISAKLKIDNLFYSDYMAYQDITGELLIDDKKLHAKDLQIKFHESPMNLDALFKFEYNQQRPYDIKFNTTLAHFKIGEFLQELNPKHVPRADGVFDVNVDIYGKLSNLSQFRNELLFNLDIDGKNGVYHLIPSHDVMMRSSGEAMAIVGEVVSVIPTSGFGLGIVNRVIRFTKDIHYDVISMHLTRQSDLNTTIDQFQIISPELHLFATGGLTFVEDTRLFDQPLDMTAQLDLAGEGAAIFYGLGLLNDEQDEYGFWKGPLIKFSGTLNHQNDNFNEIINKAKSGTVVGGITNPFSGLIGNFKYRWFGDAPNYDELSTEKNKSQTNKTQTKIKSKTGITPKIKPEQQNSSFFEETF